MPSTETTVGREPIQLVEIRQPFCTLTFGVTPCTATGTADQKCYNTRATCLDPANYTKGSLSLWFGKGGVGAASDLTYVIPSLVGVKTASSRINLATSSPDASGLGNRAMASITFADHPHTDRIVDSYLSGRSWDPYQRASFWGKWAKRNLYRTGISVIVYEGYAGQATTAMRKREYILESLQGPDASGRVTVRAKDVLAKAEERKAKAPTLSPGRLDAAIDAVVTSFEVANAATSDYPATGAIRIDSEVMTYSAVATSTNGITFTISGRATDGSTVATHDADALVQECLRYTSQTVDQIASDLLTTYAGIQSSWLDTTNWATETGIYLSGYILSTLITEPVSVAALMAELMQEAGCYFWWDERASLVKMAAVHGMVSEPPLLDEGLDILAGSFRLSEQPRSRVSQAWVYFGRRDPTEAVSKTANYKFAQIQADLEAESSDEYGEASVRVIKSRWLQTSAQALSTTSKIVVRYRDTPRECVFDVDAKDRAYWIGSTVRINHHKDVDAFGANNITSWLIVAAEEIDPGHTVRLTAHDVTLYGKTSTIQAAGASDYVGDGSDPYSAAFIGDAAGLLSDGENSARIA